MLLWKWDLELVVPDSFSGHARFHGHDVRHGPALLHGPDGRYGSGSKIFGRIDDGKSSCTQMEGHAGLHDAILHGDDKAQDVGGNA
jgi:hypothetical protein